MGQLLHHKKQVKEKPARRQVATRTYTLERIIKGFANHRRIEVLFLLKKTPELSVEEIAEKLRMNFKTASVHIQKLAIAGLVMKRNAGVSVRHKLTVRGEHILIFLRKLE